MFGFCIFERVLVGQAILPASGLSGGSLAQADSFRQSTKKRSGTLVSG